MSEPEILIVPDREAGSDEAATRIASALASAVTTRGRADFVTTGGSTPAGIYRRLVDRPLLAAVPWPFVHVWWGDDRFVPRDHPASNVKAFDDILLGIGAAEEGTAGGDRPGVPIPFGQIHPFRTGEAIGEARGAPWCAAALADELRGARLDTAGGWPIFDLMLVGVGPDGHLLSVFPGSAAFDTEDLALAVPAPTHIEPHLERVTLNPRLLDTARAVLVVVLGADKAPAIAEVFGEVHDPRRWPAQLARRAGATWILDAAAAAGLPG